MTVIPRTQNLDLSINLRAEAKKVAVPLPVTGCKGKNKLIQIQKESNSPFSPSGYRSDLRFKR
jgi:hypothetical protein